ncbi:MAG: type IV pilus assembly protein PilM [Thermodesulfobacteriota bacterium]
MDFKLPHLRLPSLPKGFSLSLGKKQPLSLGLDIGSHSIKICEFVQTAKGGYKLLALGSALMPPDSMEDGALLDPDAVAKVIATLVSNLKIRGKQVAFSVSGYSVIVKKINLEVMTEAELEKHIHEEAEQYIPFDINDVYLDFQDLHTNTEGEERTDVMLVAAKREVVDGYLNMLRTAGLKPVVVDVDAFALENAFEANFGLKENVVLIDIGASKMNINIISGGISTLARDVVLGSRQLTEQIQGRFDLPYEEAEALKTGSQPAGDLQEGVERIFTETCRQWVTEIKRALDFYASNYPDVPISRLVLSGGGARIAGLADFIARETGIPAEIFNPFATAECDTSTIDPVYLKAIAPQMALAAGLATRPVEF